MAQSDEGFAQAARPWRVALLKACARADAAAAAHLAAAPPPGPRPFDFLVDGNLLTPLIAACLGGQAALAQALLAWGASPDFSDEIGWSPLHWSCQSGRLAMAAILLEAGANPNARCREGATPLHFCAQSGQIGCAAALLAHGADSGMVDPGTLATPRHWAAHDPRLSALMGEGAPAPDGVGRGALHWAIRQACEDARALAACRCWAALGESPAARDQRGASPLDLAISRGFGQSAAFLISIGESRIFERAAAGAARALGPARI